MARKKTLFISKSFKIIESFKQATEEIPRKEELITRIKTSWAYAGKLINELTKKGYIKKTKKGRNKILSLTEKGKKLYHATKEMRKLI